MSDEKNSIKLNNQSHSSDITINVINDHSYRYDKLDLINLGICLLVYMIFCFVGGVQECADSRGYIVMKEEREPVYCLFLWFFRSVFGTNIYLNIVVFVQNLLMTFGVWWSVTYLKKRFYLKEYIALLMFSVHFGVAILCQFFAGRSSIYPNSIMTEGITTSLWLVFITLLWKAIDSKNIKSVIVPLVLTALLMDTRKQMAFGFIVFFAVILICWTGTEKYVRKMLTVTLIIVLSVVLSLGINRAYNLVMGRGFNQNTRDANLVLTTSLYVADRVDADLIKEDAVRELFIETMDEIDAKKCNINYAGKGWRSIADHYGEHYDKITIDTTKYKFEDFAVKRGFKEGVEAKQEADRMSNVIVTSLLADNLGKYFKVFMSSFCNGLVNTVAKRNVLLEWYSLVVYIVYIILLVMNLKDRHTKSVGFIGLSVLISIFVNVGVTAALIFTQTRYMIYNMALFYVAFILMAYTSIYKYFVSKGKRI